MGKETIQLNIPEIDEEISVVIGNTYMGPQGPTGPTGPQGPSGADGAQGPTGPKGEDGSVSFEDLTPEQIAQLTGPTGPTGPQGSNGADGADGPTGPQGPQGPTGEQGPQGPTGPQGADGTVSFEDLTPEQLAQLTGPTGPQGPQGPSGADGAQGPTGPTGPQGEMGPTGPAGQGSSLNSGEDMGIWGDEGHPYTLSKIDKWSMPNDKLAIVKYTKEEGGWGVTGTSNSFTFDLAYLGKDFNGGFGGFEVQDVNGNWAASMISLTSANTIEYVINVDNNPQISGTIETYGTHIIGSGETLESTIVWTDDGKFTYTFNNTVDNLNVTYTDYPIITTQYGGVLYGVTQQIHNGLPVYNSLPASGKNGQTIYVKEASGLTQYTWSDSPVLKADIDYSSATTENSKWLVRFKYESIPNNTTIAVLYHQMSNTYAHIVYESGALHKYTSDSADTYTASTYKNIPQNSLTNCGAGYESNARCYWTENEVIIYEVSYNSLYSINTNAFFTSGWYKDEHKVRNGVIYQNYNWYDGDYNFIIRNHEAPMYLVGFKINSEYYQYQVYSNQNQPFGPIYAPTTTGTTGYVCVAGNGNTAPTWAEPSTLTNGVKFWKGTQAQYDALSGTGYDSSTLYIITPQ